MPQPLATRLNITPHSTVRIKPVKSTIKIASSIRLQPLKPAVSARVVVCGYGVSFKGILLLLFLKSLMSMWSLTFSLQSEEEDDEAIQTAFLGWLHTQSHEPLACLTARSGSVLLHGTDGDLFYKSANEQYDKKKINNTLNTTRG